MTAIVLLLCRIDRLPTETALTGHRQPTFQMMFSLDAQPQCRLEVGDDVQQFVTLVYVRLQQTQNTIGSNDVTSSRENGVCSVGAATMINAPASSFVRRCTASVLESEFSQTELPQPRANYTPLNRLSSSFFKFTTSTTE